MSTFTLYTVGTIALLGSVVYGPILFHIPQIWIGIGEVGLVAVAVISAAATTNSVETRQRPDA